MWPQDLEMVVFHILLAQSIVWAAITASWRCLVQIHQWFVSYRWTIYPYRWVGSPCLTKETATATIPLLRMRGYSMLLSRAYAYAVWANSRSNERVRGKWAFVYPASPRRPKHKHAPFLNIDHPECQLIQSQITLKTKGARQKLRENQQRNSTTDSILQHCAKKGALPLPEEDRLYI